MADRELGLGGRVHLDSIDPFAARVHGHVRRVNFDVRLSAFEHGVIHQALRDLDLDVGASQVGDLGLGPLVEAQDVCVVQFEFRA